MTHFLCTLLFTAALALPVHAQQQRSETVDRLSRSASQQLDASVAELNALREEIAAQMAGIREWGGHFVVAIPEVEVLP